jgi:hypothetical protein
MTMSPRRQFGRDPITGMTIPQRDRLALCPSASDSVVKSGANPIGIVADESAGTQRKRDRTFGVLAQREAGYAQNGRLFLESARIGEYDGRPRYER